MINFVRNGEIVNIGGNYINLRHNEKIAREKIRNDANGFFIGNEGKTIESRVFEAKRPTDGFFLGLINQLVLDNKFSDTYEWSLSDYVGDADFITERGTEYKTVDVSQEKFLQNIGLIGTQVNFNESEAKDITKSEIINKKFSSAYRSILRRLRQVFFDGYAPLKIYGLFSHPHLASVTSEIATGAVNTTKKKWGEKNSKEIVTDIVNAYQSVVDATNGTILPDTLLVSQAAISSAMPETMGQLNAYQEFISMTQSAVASRLGVENGFTMKVLTSLNNRFKNKTNGFIFFLNDPECVEQIIPTVFEQYPIFTDNGLFFRSLCVGRTGGLVVRQPKGFCIKYGI